MKAKILGLLAVGLLAGPMAANAAGVVVGGKEWRQLTETTNFTWNQVAGVCNATTGACSGSIGAVSFAGWTWAANTDIQALFEQLILPASTQFPTPTTDYYSDDSIDIDAAIGLGAFQATFQLNFLEDVLGWSRTKSTPTFSYAPIFRNFASGTDFAMLNNQNYDLQPVQARGVWLFRTVPEPGSLALLGFGLAGLGLTRRRRAH